MSSTDLFFQAQQLFESQQFAQAAKLYQEILRTDPQHIGALSRLGVIACRIGMPQRAIRILRSALRAGGESASLLNDLGKAYVQVDDWNNAQRCFQRCIQRYPRSPLGYVSQAYLENAAGRYQEASQIYDAAMKRVADSFELQFNVATFLRERGELEASVEMYDRLIANHPDVPLLKDGRARALLQQQKWHRGWDDYEARFSIEEEAAKINLQLPIQRWNGQSLAGCHMLVLCEQGVGDEVQFASCYQDVLALAERCTFTCSPRLLPIFSRSFPQAEFIAVASDQRESWQPTEPNRFDFFSPAGSLPQTLRRTEASFSGNPYLIANSGKAPSSAAPRVGVSWWGGAVADQIRKRSVPWEVFQRLFDLPQIQFVNLQHGCRDHQTTFQTADVPSNLQSYPDLDPYQDLDGWLELISSLDLLVSVDNSNVHFAGALGVETWLLLSDHPNWRWPADQVQSNWYRSVRFIRKNERPWNAVVDDAISRLESRFGRRAA